MIITKTEKIKYGLDSKEDNKKKTYIAEDKKDIRQVEKVQKIELG